MGDQLKVVDERGSYVRVETERGDVGYVPSVMVTDQVATNPIPLGTGEPAPLAPVDSIDPVDPAGLPPLPPDGGGFVAPEPEVPPISVEPAPTPDPIPAPTPAPIPGPAE